MLTRVVQNTPNKTAMQNTLTPRRIAWETERLQKLFANCRDYEKAGVDGMRRNIQNSRNLVQRKIMPAEQNFRQKKVGFCGNSKQIFQEFCDNTTLHGLKYVGGQGRHNIDRFLWLMAFIMVVLAAVYFIQMVYDKWDKTPVIVSIGPEATEVQDIPLGAVTVCPPDMYLFSHDHEHRNITSDHNKKRHHVNHAIMMKKKEFFPKDNTIESLNIAIETIKKVSKPCEEVFKVCKIGGKTKNCTDIFLPVLTEDGICCSFNNVKRSFVYRKPFDLLGVDDSFLKDPVDWNPEEGYPDDSDLDVTPQRPRNGGIGGGLYVQMHAYQGDDNEMTIMVHSPLETPRAKLQTTIKLADGVLQNIKLNPNLVFSSNSLRSIKTQYRKCYFVSEKYLQFFRIYTRKNCLLECEVNITLNKCGCVPYYLYMDDTTPICNVALFNCTKAVRRQVEWGSAEIKDLLQNCNCLPGCSDVRYSPVLASSSTFLLSLHEPLAAAKFYFADSQYMNYYKSELFGFSDFLASTGGLLGLFFGFSFLSGVEVLYFSTIRACRAMLQRNRTNVSNPPTSVNENVKSFEFVY